MHTNCKYAIAGTLLGLSLVALGWLAMTAEPLSIEPQPTARTLSLLWNAESSRGKDMIGDSGHAIGHFQHHRDAWAYGCKQLKVNWPYSDADNLARAAAVTAACWSGQARNDLLSGDIEMLIRRHRLPNAPMRESNDKYLNYVLTKGE